MDFGEEALFADFEAANARKPLTVRLKMCSEGEHGWDCLRSGAYDIALLDIHLPGVSGVDLSWCYQQLLMQNHSAKNTPPDAGPASAQTIIIACTSDEDANMALLEQCAPPPSTQPMAPPSSKYASRL